MIVIARKSGQLGNRLFVFAHVIAFAMRHRVTVVNTAFDAYGLEFESTRSDPLNRYPAASLPRWATSRRQWCSTAGHRISRVPEKYERLGVFLSGIQGGSPMVRWLFPPDHVEVSLNELPYSLWARTRGILLLGGWLIRDYPDLRTHAAAIRDHFTPVQPHRMNVDRLLSRIRGAEGLVIGVHVRRGDYKHHLGGRYYYDISRYSETMHQVLALFPTTAVHFLLCSDGALDVAQFAPFTVSVGTGNPVEDMYALARCDYLLGPPSTFSGWAAFYGNVPLHIMPVAPQPLIHADFRSYEDEDFLPYLDQLLRPSSSG